MNEPDRYERFKAWVKRFHHYHVIRHLASFEAYEAGMKERAAEELRKRTKGEG